ncbi:endonuclease/exonuclease/phosphatase family protein [Roseibium aggregatum]|uniref:Endonuclease/exonuclease/phosphatase family protein n=1 Tax=Roseibium aggregatum TaxID=187304 RepID=A0A939EJ99_9HYPH|nr:endonuclease/exonuclease/phosphatase family protein [Roseibium aggregatum]MBN9673432.1 endonuclease/exonuclease/phosphatase family protein [Roseibium aggregatum]
MSLNYTGLRRFKKKAEAKRCAGRLLSIRKRLAPLRQRKSDSTLLLATWNIRDFDSNKFKWGPRLPETFYYLAEMISHFDLVAIQEVNRDLTPLRKLMDILGREWDYIVTDTTEGFGGNAERMAFVYNTEKVWFRKIAGEVVLPDGQLVVTEKTKKTEDGVIESKSVKNQFARTPFLVAFQSGWFKFSLCTVHIYFGSESGAKLKRRVDEIKRLVKFFADRQDKENRQTRDGLGNVENYILLGDFNVVSPEHKTMQALKSNDFVVPKEIDGDEVRKEGEHYYDQIATRVRDKRFKVVAGGMIDMFEDVFRDDAADRKLYSSHVPKKDTEKNPEYAAKDAEARYRKWRTWQMSDHAPLWIEIETDFSEHYLQEIAGE